MERINLHGDWSLTYACSPDLIPVKIPGDNYSALIDAGIMKDPYVGRNELDAQVFALEEYEFSRTFTVNGDFLKAESARLRIDSLDTFARISINGASCGSSSNQFASFRQEVKRQLTPGDNIIRVLFQSAEKEAERRAAALPYPLPHTIHPVQSPHRNLVRKVQCHSGWDWGPCLMVCGIYGEISLEASDSGFIDYLHAETRREKQSWAVDVTVEFTALRPMDMDLVLTLEGQTKAFPVALSHGTNIITRTIYIENPDPWWPSGYGTQKLYTLTAKLAGESASRKIGFRTIDVIVRDDGDGRSLTFRVNGRDIFCKGANWIPVDALPARQTRERYEFLLSSSADANMNMLRVWGGGQYEHDCFYDLCDEKGILIWQDFMFSCALYPASPEFLKEVEEEVRHQVKRLRDHPCVALWCGNNEDIGSLQWFPESKLNRDRYLVDYDRLNEGVIGKIVRDLDPHRTWWPSSPSAGPGDYSDCWHDDSKGDMHYWSVWHEGKPFEAYYEVVPRFCSEFGFQSFPSMETVRSFADEGQWNVTSPVMEHHQKNARGNTIITSTLSRYFRFPMDFENFLYLSQVQQAMAITMAVEYWRSKRPRCMGALYWQLNDNWPVASWSSIEYSGKWKLLHYQAIKFFAPLHILAYASGPDTFEVWGVNDTWQDEPGTAELRIIDFTGRELYKEEVPVNLKAESAIHIKTVTPAHAGHMPDRCFLAMLFSNALSHMENTIFFDVPKHCELEEPGITLTVDDNRTITLSAKKPAFYVSLEAEGYAGRFSDNMFTLIPGQDKRVRYLPAPRTSGYPQKDSRQQEGSGSVENFKNSIKLRHLKASYR